MDFQPDDNNPELFIGYPEDTATGVEIRIHPIRAMNEDGSPGHVNDCLAEMHIRTADGKTFNTHLALDIIAVINHELTKVFILMSQATITTYPTNTDWDSELKDLD